MILKRRKEKKTKAKQTTITTTNDVERLTIMHGFSEEFVRANAEYCGMQEILKLSTDDPMYDNMVQVMVRDVSLGLIDQLKKSIGYPEDGIVLPITDEEYERAFRGCATSGSADVVAGAAVSDLSVESMCAVVDSAAGVRCVPSSMKTFPGAVGLVEMAVGRGFLLAKAEYDKLCGFGDRPYDASKFHDYEYLRRPWFLGVESDDAGFVDSGVGQIRYRLDCENDIVRVDYPVASLAAEEHSPALMPRQMLSDYAEWVKKATDYDVVMLALYGAVFRQFFRRLKDMLVVGPTVSVSLKATVIEPPVRQVKLKSIGASLIDFGSDDVVVFRGDETDFVDALEDHDDIPRICQMGTYYAKGRRNFVPVVDVMAQGLVRDRDVVDIAMAVWRVREVVVIVPGDQSEREVYSAEVPYTMDTLALPDLQIELRRWLRPVSDTFVVREVGLDRADLRPDRAVVLMADKNGIFAVQQVLCDVEGNRVVKPVFVGQAYMSLGYGKRVYYVPCGMLQAPKDGLSVDAVVVNIAELHRVAEVTVLRSGGGADVVREQWRIPAGGLTTSQKFHYAEKFVLAVK